MAHYFVIVNPASGYKKGLSILNRIRNEFENNGHIITIGISEYKNHPFELIHNAEIKNIDGICVIGGDGTMHEVINGMLKRTDNLKRPIGLIPAGTGNSLMHDLDCLDPVNATKRIIANQTRKLDIFEINANGIIMYGFNILGWGIPVDINTLAEKMRWLFGQRYNVASLIEVVKNRTRKVKIKVDDHIIEEDCGFFLACNTQYTGNGMRMAPMAILDDGLINILIAKKVSRFKLLALFTKVFKGKHVNDPVIEWHKARSFSIITETNQPLNIDGQAIGFTPVHAKILPDQIEIFA